MPDTQVLHLIDSSGFYGAERVIVTLCSEMLKTTFTPFVGCIMPQGGDLPEVGVMARKLGIEVIPVQQSNKLDWQCLKEVILKNNISIIHCHGYKPSLLSYVAEGFSGCRIIVTCHLWTNETLRLKLYAFLESLIMKRVHDVVAVSEAIKDDIIKVGVNSSKLSVILNGIDLQQWEMDEKLNISKYKKQLGLQQDSMVLGLFGRLYKQKGHQYLFQALSKIKNKKIELICVGDGPLLQELQLLAEQLGISAIVHFLGFRSDVKNLLQLTDLFVMPSLSEGLPMALLEAMAMRKAVIVTPVGAIPSVIEDGNDGLLVPRKSVEELARAIIDLIDSPGKIEILGENAKKKVISKFSGQVMTGQYLEIYKNMLKN